mmetsp:Transcript_20804/g.30756  ORF Transcript_20804/g.30756 Transcript_20804/m.30756 type:complete len:119 (-) Transcript_20804:2208-2564(-)
MLANEKVEGGLLFGSVGVGAGVGVGPVGESERGDLLCSIDDPNVPVSDRDPGLDTHPAVSAKETRGDEDSPLVSREFEKEKEALTLCWTRFPVLIAIGFVDDDCAGGKTIVVSSSSLF